MQTIYYGAPGTGKSYMVDELVKAFDIFVLFTEDRLQYSDIPKAMFRYELRHDDNWSGISTLEERVMVNFAGTILSKSPIDLGVDGYIDIEKRTFYFTNIDISIEDYLRDDLNENFQLAK